jgi:hypothetical protein
MNLDRSRSVGVVVSASAGGEYVDRSQRVVSSGRRTVGSHRSLVAGLRLHARLEQRSSPLNRQQFGCATRTVSSGRSTEHLDTSRVTHQPVASRARAESRASDAWPQASSASREPQPPRGPSAKRLIQPPLRRLDIGGHQVICNALTATARFRAGAPTIHFRQHDPACPARSGAAADCSRSMRIDGREEVRVLGVDLVGYAAAGPGGGERHAVLDQAAVAGTAAGLVTGKASGQTAPACTADAINVASQAIAVFNAHTLSSSCRVASSMKKTRNRRAPPR